MTYSTLPTVTTRNFYRNCWEQPKGRGSWLFQKSLTEEAFDRDLVGEMRSFNGTYAQARKAARESFQGEAEFVAVLP